VEQEQKPSQRSFIDELVSEWKPTRAQILWTIRIVLVLIVLLGFLTLVGLPFGITLWEWLKLLIVPAVIAAGGLWFNRQQRDREMDIAEQRSQDEALQAYLDQISQLLTDKDRPLHRAQLGDSISMVARARTLTVLASLDGSRKGKVVRFLCEAGLLTVKRHKDLAIVPLVSADLRCANLSNAALVRTDLSVTDLSQANLEDAALASANLEHATLRNANLRRSFLPKAYLDCADLRNADLRNANLSDAKLGPADIRGGRAGFERSVYLRRMRVMLGAPTAGCVDIDPHTMHAQSVE
jgi:uncharacterized protein YjbI with pentapeptide repeats